MKGRMKVAREKLKIVASVIYIICAVAFIAWGIWIGWKENRR